MRGEEEERGVERKGVKWRVKCGGVEWSASCREKQRGAIR